MTLVLHPPVGVATVRHSSSAGCNFCIEDVMTVVLLSMLLMTTLSADQQPLAVVNNLDIDKYAGRWFEIARFPNRFQDQCTGDVTAEYVPRPDGRITVRNRYRTSDGRWDDAEGIARRPSKAPASVLEVRFAPAFLSFLPMVWGDYQVIALDEGHTYSLVGTPDRKYLWILARAPKLDDAVFEKLLSIASAQGFDVRRLIRTPQTADQ